jgi:gamma-glutamylcyclotransferase (GGCT)/AIG2-like uncharacterized protein YtfP
MSDTSMVNPKGASSMEQAHSTQSLTRDQLSDALIRINILRTQEPTDPMALDLLEGAIDALFSVSKRLIVYGSLAPGGPNHGLIADLKGEWKKGWVTGELLERGWSAAMGYPALRWCPEGTEIEAYLLVSDQLAGFWRRLDEFEGLEYSRIWAPFWTADGEVSVGNLYAMECDLNR